MPEPFTAYLAMAAQGRNSLLRLTIGTVIVVAAWLAGTVAVLLAGALHAVATGRSDDVWDAFTSTPISAASLLLSVAAIWPGLWLALRVVHRRKLASVFGADGRLSSPDTVRGFAAALLVGLPVTAIALAFEPSTVRTDLSIAHWAALLLPYAALIFLQSSAEEALFRGYLVQGLGHRFRSPWIWAGLPAGLFTLGHWNAAALPYVNVAMLASVAVLAGAMTLLVYRTGNLGAAIGAHTGNNVVAFLFAGPAGDFEPTALFQMRALEDPTWTALEALAGFLANTIFILLMLWLLFDPRSPLCLTGRRPSGAIDA